MSRLALVTVHHEGAGVPTDTPRGAHGGYTYWIGPNSCTRLRSPYDSWATLHFNHVSVDVCLSGDRDQWPVTKADIWRMASLANDCRNNGELISNPVVRPHKLSPGSNTVCPGADTFADWSEVAACFTTGVPTPAPQPVNGHRTLVAGMHGSDVTQLQHELNVGCGQFLATDGMFGPLTWQAVHSVQAFFHLAVDGICGPQTWSIVDYCYAQKGGK